MTKDVNSGYNMTRLACYTAYFTMSTIFSLPPLLFVTLREMYGISYTLLGTLVLINFFTQLSIDLIFTFFSKYFNVAKIVRIMPLITSLGLFIYALSPVIFPEQVYVGLFLGTIIFSVSAGLSEVLLSPVIAALPSKNPQRDMSMLHSLYAFGVFFVVIVSTAFLKLFGDENWMYLTIFLGFLPIIASVMFFCSPIPDMEKKNNKASAKGTVRRTKALTLCILCIFFGSCAENAMSSWISGFMENSLGIDKTVGDVFGMAMFAILLGVARISYAKFGKNISKVLLFGMIGASVCYLVAGLSSQVIPAFIACILTGVFTAMLWPGTLIMMEENVPDVGIVAYAMMASGGDLGASISPQLLGFVADKVAESDFAVRLSGVVNLTTEQIGLKSGMLVSAVFPIIGTFLIIYIIKYFKRYD